MTILVKVYPWADCYTVPPSAHNLSCYTNRFGSAFYKFVEAIIITKRILNHGVNLTFGELLPSAVAVEKQLTKAIFKKEALQFRANTLSLARVLGPLAPILGIL